MSGGDSGPSRVAETQAQQTLARIAIDKYNDYQRRFAPLENWLMGAVYTTDAEYDQGEGWAATASEQQFAGTRDQFREAQFGQGINPASGGFIAGMGDLKRSEATSTGMNMAAMDSALATQETAGLMGVTQLGRGQSATGLQLYGEAASSAQDQAISDARAALNESLSNQRFIGQALGVGAAAATEYFRSPSDAITSSDFNIGAGGVAGYGSAPAQGLSGL